MGGFFKGGEGDGDDEVGGDGDGKGGIYIDRPNMNNFTFVFSSFVRVVFYIMKKLFFLRREGRQVGR